MVGKTQWPMVPMETPMMGRERKGKMEEKMEVKDSTDIGCFTYRGSQYRATPIYGPSDCCSDY
eukprot:3743094-Amphidinium_carterae.1